MITVSEAKILRERFYEGDLTQAEVAQLAAFMLSARCPEAWRDERAMFAALSRPAPLPEGFAERLQTHVAATAAAPERVPQALRPVHRRGSWLAAGLSVAACAAVALWLGLRTEVVYPDRADRPAMAQMQLPPSPKVAEAPAKPAPANETVVHKIRKHSSKKQSPQPKEQSAGTEKQLGFSADRTAFPADRERDMVDAADASVPAPDNLARRQAELAARRAELAQMQAALWQKQADLALRNALLVAASRMPQAAEPAPAAEVPHYEPTAQTPAEQQAELCQVAALMHEVRAEYATAFVSRVLLLPEMSVPGGVSENEISHPQ